MRYTKRLWSGLLAHVTRREQRREMEDGYQTGRASRGLQGPPRSLERHTGVSDGAKSLPVCQTVQFEGRGQQHRAPAPCACGFERAGQTRSGSGAQHGRRT